MRYIFLILFSSVIVTNSFAQKSETNEQTFFNLIFKKYPDRYFSLGSNSFSEEYNSDTKKPVRKSSFIIVNDKGTKAQKYLRERKDSILAKYLPSFHFYSGKYTCHLELSVNGLGFVGFLSKGNADFVFDTTTSGFKSDFIKAIKGIKLSGKMDMEKFCSALLTALDPGLLLNYKENIYQRTNLTWINDTLVVENFYKREKEQTSTILYVVFAGDELVDITLNNCR